MNPAKNQGRVRVTPHLSAYLQGILVLVRQDRKPDYVRAEGKNIFLYPLMVEGVTELLIDIQQPRFDTVGLKEA
jgi:hypothetical protein